MEFSIAQIAQALGARAEGDVGLMMRGPAEPRSATEYDLALALNPKYADALGEGAAAAALLWDGADWRAMGLKAALFAPRPRYALAGLNRVFERRPEVAAGAHPTAIIDPSARIGDGAAIGPFVVIGARAVIGANARILSHASIAEDAVIGADCLLHSGVRIGARVRIGDRFIAQPNAVVGGDGFSFVTPDAGVVEAARAGHDPSAELAAQHYARINSLGAVIIGDDVELGAGCTVDRGTITDTIIGAGSKLDNLVMIGHNVRVGTDCLLCAQAGVGGSSIIEDRVVLGGQVGVADHVTVGTGVVAAGKSGISSNVPPNRFIMGNPAIRAEQNIESYKIYRRLPKLAEKVENLQKAVSKAAAND